MTLARVKWVRPGVGGPDSATKTHPRNTPEKCERFCKGEGESVKNGLQGQSK